MPSMLDIPADLSPLQDHLAGSLSLVERRVADALRSDLPAVHSLCRHVARYHGKMIRPALTILSALAAGQAAQPHASVATDPHTPTPDPILVVATVCEMVHLATLVHDDVLDTADTRRGQGTINALHGNEAAVILGDYLFSAAFHLCSSLGDKDTSQSIASVGMTLCAGELLQNAHRHDLSLDEATYFGIVERKTASLIAAACRLGAKHAGAPANLVAALERFGLRLGVAFQIQDDLLDLTGDQRIVGKSLLKDLEKGKLTLPMIHHLTTADAVQRGRTLLLLEDAADRASDTAEALRRALESTRSIAHARTVAETLVREAREALGQCPPSPARRMMELMADAVVTRAF
ncbi:MAG: polyprenyl synthetase family protein [Phycisphaerales bacterium]|jgi:octaprenyl-diphosphate synthase